jgi:hypothetical protein
MEQLYEEEAEDEKEVEGEDEEDLIEAEEQVQQVPPKTPSRRVHKNHPSDQIIGNKDAGVETRRRICSPEQIVGQLRGEVVNQLLLCLKNYSHFKLFTKHLMTITMMQGSKK